MASYDEKLVKGKVLRLIRQLLDGKIDTTEKGAANGVAVLDASGKIPTAQLPSGAMGSNNVISDTTANWDISEDVPDDTIILVYTDKQTSTIDGQSRYIPGIKVGDGIHLPRDLPFIDAGTLNGVSVDNIVAKQVGHKLTFGNGGVFEYDGSADVTVPVYGGEYIVGDDDNAGYQEEDFNFD